MQPVPATANQSWGWERLPLSAFSVKVIFFPSARPLDDREVFLPENGLLVKAAGVRADVPIRRSADFIEGKPNFTRGYFV